MLKEYKNKQINNQEYMNKDTKPKNKKVSFFDPVAGAYREISLDKAKKYIKHLDELKKQIK